MRKQHCEGKGKRSDKRAGEAEHNEVSYGGGLAGPRSSASRSASAESVLERRKEESEEEVEPVAEAGAAEGRADDEDDESGTAKKDEAVSNPSSER